MLAPPLFKRVKPSAPAAEPASSIPMRGSMPEWAAILRECKFPSHAIVLDFETYFDPAYSLSKMSGIEYIADKRFEELGVSLLHMDAERPFAPLLPYFWTDAPRAIRNLQDEFGEHFERATIIIQNAPFDCMILARRYGIFPKYVIDTAGLDRHIEARRSHKLKHIAARLGLPPKGNTEDFMYLSHKPRPRFLTGKRNAGKPPIIVPAGTPDQFAALGDYANNDSLLEWEVFARLIAKLTRPEFELRVMNHTLLMYTDPRTSADEKYAIDLTAAMRAEMDNAVERTGLAASEISGNKTFEAALGAALAEHGERIPVKQGKVTKNNPSGLIPALAKTDESRGDLLKHKSETVRDLLNARIAIKSWPLHISRVEGMVQQSKACDGMLPVPLKYYGAHTGRWSGDENINLQNLPSRPDPNRPETELCLKIRGVIVPPPGHKLVIADASQVEARGLSWLADQDDLNEMFRNKVEIYCEYAGRMVGRKLRKKTKNDPKPLAKYLDRMRNMGKVQVLGCGYGMGHEKCVDFAKNSYGVVITLDEAVQLVRSYRESVPQIVRFWNDVERAFTYATKYGECVQLAHGLIFSKEGDNTIITLPSGRKLYYEAVRIRRNIKGYESLSMPDPGKPGAWIHLWGGLIVENIVQATCRDLLAEAILGMEEIGHRVALTVHDEIVAVSPDAEAEKCLEDLLRLLREPPAWAAGCPLDAEGSVADRYGK